MELVNFVTVKKGPARDHAAFLSKMFEDIRRGPSQQEPVAIAIVRATEEDLEHDDVKYGMDFVRESAQQVVNWYNLPARDTFLDERESVATGGVA